MQPVKKFSAIQGGQGQMSGIAALAAAAAATSKMNTVGVSSAAVGTPSSAGAIKVVTPTLVKPAGIKVTPVPARQPQRSKCAHTSPCEVYIMSWYYNTPYMARFDVLVMGPSPGTQTIRVQQPIGQTVLRQQPPGGMAVQSGKQIIVHNMVGWRQVASSQVLH